MSISFAFCLNILLISEVALRAARTHEVVVGLAALRVATHRLYILTTHIISLAKRIHSMFRFYELYINNKL